MKRRKYLNNRDLLAEIHKSKTSYCSYINEEDSDFDIILPNIDRINIRTIAQAKRNRADKLAKLAYEAAIERGEKVKQAEFALDWKKVPKNDLVFRIMTFDHVPLQLGRKKNPKTIADHHTQCNFPPFQHFRFNDSDELVCVGKSHWIGGMENGYFSRDHGAMTKKLALMYLKLVDRYATRSNWRGYCVDEATEALTQRGWVSGNELTTDDQIMSFNGSNMIWSPVRSIFQDTFDGKMFRLTSRSIDALMTPGHNIVTDEGLVKVEYLLESDRIVVMGDGVESSGVKTHSDSLVELLGWITTEGNYQYKKKIITIYQNEGPHADRIRNCLNNLGFQYTERPSSKSTNISFSLRRAHWETITEIMPHKNLTMEFIMSLTEDQRELLIDTMIDGDGHRTGLLMRYTQKDKDHIDVFQALCALHGLKSNTHFAENKMSYGKPTSYYTMNIFSKRGNKTRGECVDLHGGKNNGRQHIGKGKQNHPNFPTVDYKGLVWCPETDYGCFLARRNGKVYLTGNSYNDEMKSAALLQLSQIGLQFDESKSQNPFAYYTAAITNSFTRVLNLEKKNQNIRDDILEQNGLNASYTRQYQNELNRE